MHRPGPCPDCRLALGHCTNQCHAWHGDNRHHIVLCFEPGRGDRKLKPLHQRDGDASAALFKLQRVILVRLGRFRFIAATITGTGLLSWGCDGPADPLAPDAEHSAVQHAAQSLGKKADQAEEGNRKSGEQRSHRH